MKTKKTKKSVKRKVVRRPRQKQKSEVTRFTQYMIGGGAQFWSGYAAFAFFDLILHIPFWPTKIMAYFVGASVNFFIERYWVFDIKRGVSKKQLETSAQRFYSLMAFNFVLDLAIVGGLRELGVTPYIGQFISAGFFTVFNYVLFKIWVFKSRRRRRYA